MKMLKKFILSLAAWAAGWLPLPLKRAIYRSGPLARILRRELNRAAPHGLTQVAVAAGGLAGCTLLLDMQAEKDYWLGTYEPELQAALAELVAGESRQKTGNRESGKVDASSSGETRLASPGVVAYDVGANIGYISLLLARSVGEAGKVFAFEALPDNLSRLRSNIELNGMQGRVQVIPAAVIDGERPVRFLVGPSGGMGKAEGSAGRQDVAYAASVEVAGLSLDDFVYRQGNPPPQVVKMDIEGGEVLALPGMTRLLAEAHPLLLMELHGPQAARAAWETLNAAGYRICRMAPGYPPVASLEALDWKAYLVAFGGEK